jgi:integrase/recombinase XerD
MASNVLQRMVAEILQRKHNETHENLLLQKEKHVSQAKTLNDKELKLLLLYLATRKYGVRDKTMVLMTHWAGMRIGEVAAVRLCDVLAADGSVKEEIRLTAEQTKGKRGRTVVLCEKLRKEVLTYLQWRFALKQLIAVTYTDAMNKPLFSTQKREGFDANTACTHLHNIYRAAGIEGASSHSGRRSFLTRLSAKSVPLRVMMELAGHRQAQTTMRYCDVTADMKRAAVELL